MFEDSASTVDYDLTEDTDSDSGEATALTDSQTVRLEAEVTAEVGPAADPGLGLMLELAKRGEFDPWDVDIVALTDSYLEALDEQLDAQELGAVAKLIFYASALIHLKARALAEREAQIQAAEAALLDEVFDELTGDLLGDPLCRLRPGDMPLVYPDFMTGDGPRGALSLSPRERPPRKRGVTLVDLIAALRTYDERLAQREAELVEEPLFDGEIAFQECVEGSHQDDLEGDLISVRNELWETLPEGGSIALSQLINGERTKAAAYLALLFLAQDDEVQLEQDDFYGDVRVVRGSRFGEVVAGVHDDEEFGEADWSAEDAAAEAAKQAAEEARLAKQAKKAAAEAARQAAAEQEPQETQESGDEVSEEVEEQPLVTVHTDDETTAAAEEGQQ